VFLVEYLEGMEWENVPKYHNAEASHGFHDHGRHQTIQSGVLVALGALWFVAISVVTIAVPYGRREFRNRLCLNDVCPVSLASH